MALPLPSINQNDPMINISISYDPINKIFNYMTTMANFELTNKIEKDGNNGMRKSRARAAFSSLNTLAPHTVSRIFLETVYENFPINIFNNVDTH